MQIQFIICTFRIKNNKNLPILKKTQELFIAILGWFAIITQFILMMQNSMVSELETVIRFFSFFTILTNTLVATFFTIQIFNSTTKVFTLLTPLTVYITIVGLVYQILLRNTWNPTGLQRIVDELLHTIIPILAILYWARYQPKSFKNYASIFTWLIYPLLYISYILIRGHFSKFYPYPFINVEELGMGNVLLNSLFLFFLFIALFALFVRIKKS